MDQWGQAHPLVSSCAMAEKIDIAYPEGKLRRFWYINLLMNGKNTALFIFHAWAIGEHQNMDF